MPYEPTSNFNIGTKLEFKILCKWNIFFPFGIAPPPPPPCATQKQERPPHPRPKKRERERKQKSLGHYGEMRKHKAP